jgi:hypothetical protein
VLSTRLNAWIGLAGVFCDAVGGLYLAYDLFRRHAGPLGMLTRAVTYGLVLAVPSWMLGPAFGAIAGFGLGALVAFDQWRLARRQRLQLSSPLTQSWWAGAARGVVVGLATMPRFGLRFGLIMIAITGGLLAAVYGAGFVRTYRAYGREWKLPHSALTAALWRGAAMGGAAALTAALCRVGALFGLEIGLLVALSSVAVAAVIPRVEWWVESAPDSFFIGAGLALLSCGLILDSIPHVAALLRR